MSSRKSVRPSMREAELQRLILQLAGNERQLRPPKLGPKVREYLAENSVYPEERDAIIAVARKIDNTRGKQKAWQMVDDIRQTEVMERPPEWTEVIRTASNSLHKSTVSYLRHNGSTSGVLVQIGNRVFIATVAHAIPRKLKELYLVGHEYTENSIPVLSSKRGTADFLDVAFVEIGVDQLERLKKQTIGLDRVLVCGWGIKARQTILCGFPAQLAQATVEK